MSYAVDQDEMRALLADIAGADGAMPTRIARAARALGWSYRRAKAHWYGEAKRIDSSELQAARAAALRREETIAHAELADLRTRLALLEARLATQDADFYGPTREALRGQMGSHR